MSSRKTLLSQPSPANLTIILFILVDVELVLFPGFLYCHSKELKWKTRIAQAGMIYWAGSKWCTLQIWEWVNPQRSGCLPVWLPFFNPFVFSRGWAMGPGWFSPMQIGHMPKTSCGRVHLGCIFLPEVFTQVHGFFSLSLFFFLFFVHPLCVIS